MWILANRIVTAADPPRSTRILGHGAGWLAAALLVVAGCGPAQTPDVPPPPDTPDTTATAPPPAASPANGSSEPDTLGAWRITDLDVQSTAPEQAELQTVRTAAHEGYDRLVFEFSTDGLPAYHLEYVDRPVRACGSGAVVPLTGDGTLQVRLVGARAHTEAGTVTVAERERRLDLPVVKMLNLTCDFEGVVTWVAAVAAPNAYRVTELSAPTRLVVDVRHE